MMRLYEYQRDGRDFLMERKYALLADAMGTGKTAQAVMAAKGLAFEKILVICPASVKYNWRKEILKWQPEASINVIEGRGARIPSTQYTVINYDLIHSKPVFLQLLNNHYDLIICDEAHYLKNNRAKRTKCVYYPRGLKDRTDRVWLLTGTPILNRPVELFSHLKALAPDRLGQRYTSYIEFCKRYCAAYEGKWGWDVSGASNMGELAAKLDGFMLRRLKKHVLKQLPEKIYQTLEIPGNQILIKKERAGYEKEREGILGELATIRRKSGMAKVPYVVQHIKDILEDKQKAVIFAYHRDVISALMEKLRDYTPVKLTGDTPAHERQKAVDNFRTDESCRLFIGQIEAAGTGIDGLQDVCDTVVFAEVTWVPGQIHQAIDRCHRIGQKNAVLIQFLIAQGSIDEDIVASISTKEAVIQQVIRPQQTEREESDMSIEKNIERIADALERIEAKLGAPLVVEAPKPAPKRKSTKAVEEAPASPPSAPAEPSAPAAEPEADGPKTGAELMKYCNKKLALIESAEDRSAVIKQVAEMFREKFDVKAIKELPAEHVAEAKVAFDEIVGG